MTTNLPPCRSRRRTSSSSCPTSTIRRRWASPGIRWRRRRTSTGSPRAARASPAPTPPPRSACPARAGFATGKYPHQIGYWDNADPYDGAVPSWHHLLRERGHRVVSIGKLHFRGLPGRRSRLLGRAPADARRRRHRRREGAGSPGHPAPQRLRQARQAGRPRRVALHALRPRHRRAGAESGCARRRRATRAKPWALFVSFVCPHFPLIAPPEFYDRYPARAHPAAQAVPGERAPRPSLPARLRRPASAYDAGFGGDHGKVRRAIAGYLGLVSFMDHNVGKVLRALEDAGLADDTRVVYTSDHGDNVGARGLWGKSTMYEESAGVPLIIAGPGIAAGRALRDAGKPCRPVSVLSRMRRRNRAAGRLPRRLAARARRGRARGSGRAERVPRHRLDRRHHHAAQGPLEVRALRALPAAAVRPGERSRGAGRPRGRSGAAAPRLPARRPSCAASAIRTKSTRAPSAGKPSCSRATAGAKRRSRAATSTTPRPPASRRT